MTIDPLFDLTGKTALITGGSRGLGYEMVKAFASHGADVIIASRKLDACERVAEEVRAMGRRALAISALVSLNFKGPFRLASVIGHRMADGDGGSIINVSSTGGSMPLPAIVPYGSAKAALNAMTLSLAHEYGPKVRVNTLSAGPFLTDISKAWAPEARETARNCVRRPGKPHEVVTSALYLASPASSYTTGTNLRVDGGTW